MPQKTGKLLIYSSKPENVKYHICIMLYSTECKSLKTYYIMNMNETAIAIDEDVNIL